MYCRKCAYRNAKGTQFCKNCGLDLGATSLVPIHVKSPEPLAYAALWERFLAAILDILVLCASVILLVFLIGWAIAYSGVDSILDDEMAVAVFYAVIASMSAAYFILMESGKWSATLGMHWMNIKVLNENGNRLTKIQALGRFISLLFTYLTFFAGFLTQPLSERKQALHDLLTNTIVVQATENKKISVLATLLVLFFTFLVPAMAFFFTIGLPVYQQYILQSQLENGMQAGRETTMAVVRFYHETGRIPEAIDETGNNIIRSLHVAGVDINQQNSEVTVTFSENVRKVIRNKHLIFSLATEIDNGLIWKCHSNDIETRYLPDNCKN